MSPESPASKPPSTLGLTGLTVNAMALIAPGAFLWLTFFIQSAYGQPMAAQGMWFGIFAAVLLCLATAIAYAELSKLYPGAGSSYFFAEQAFLSKSTSRRFARVAKFTVGWASHLYYWGYPGLMVGVTALLVGYVLGQIWPDTFNAAVPSPLFMIGFCVVFSFGVAYIAYRGVSGSTAVAAAINVIQIARTAGVFSHGDRVPHEPPGGGARLDARPGRQSHQRHPEGGRQGRAGQGRQRQLRRGEERRRHRQAVHDQLRARARDADRARPERSERRR